MNEGLLAGVGTGVAGSRGRFVYQVVEASTTIAAPAWAKYVSILAAGGGGGGGGGRLAFTAAAGGGGGGGGAGSRYVYRLPLNYLNSRTRHFSVTIGAGGTSGAGGTTDTGAVGVGGNGGATTVLNDTPGATNYKMQIGLRVFGGSGGAAGAATTAAGGAGGSSYFGNAGLAGGSGSTTSTRQSEPAEFAGTNANQVGPTCIGGWGGPCKSDTPNYAGYACFYMLGHFFNASAAGDTAYQGAAGEEAKAFYESIVYDVLNKLAAAPLHTEMWWTSYTGGGAGKSGTASGTAVSGGNGGNGWRGSGGGGGGGAGVSGAVGGNGGTGGNGYAIFFWEEY